jgi:hypothetical protein
VRKRPHSKGEQTHRCRIPNNAGVNFLGNLAAELARFTSSDGEGFAAPRLGLLKEELGRKIGPILLDAFPFCGKALRGLD